MNIVMHGSLLLPLLQLAGSLLPEHHKIDFLPDQPENDEQKQIFANADVIVGFVLKDDWPIPANLKIWQVMAAGCDQVNTSSFPKGAVLCNAFGHEIPIAEYIMGSILYFQLPLVDAFERMHNNDWYYHTAESFPARLEAYDKTIGILGYGMIGKEVAKRAKAFGMKVLVCNRSPVEEGGNIDVYYSLDRVAEFSSEVDFLSISLGLVDTTANIIDARLLAGMKQDAVIINVGRAGLIEEEAIYNALKEKRIRGAVLDPQYNYPSLDNPNAKPTNLDFASLDNAFLTSHMSGGSVNLLPRRAQCVVDNIARLEREETLENIVWQSS